MTAPFLPPLHGVPQVIHRGGENDPLTPEQIAENAAVILAATERIRALRPREPPQRPVLPQTVARVATGRANLRCVYRAEGEG